MKIKLLLSLVLLVICTLGALPSRAELVMVQAPCDGLKCVYWLPKLPSIPGWHTHEASQLQDAVVLVPDGYTYTNAEYVIYARALQKRLLMDRPSLERFIAQDAEDYKALYPGIKVTEGTPIRTAQHDSLRTLTLTPTKSGHWEQVTYHEEGDHFVILVLTAKTDSGFRKARAQFLSMLSQY